METQVHHSGAPLFIAPQIRGWKMVPFRRATFHRATDLHVGNSSFKRASFYRATKTRGWKMVRFIRASFCRATNPHLRNSSRQTRFFLSRHRHESGKWFTSDAHLFIAPQTCRWEMVPWGWKAKPIRLGLHPDCAVQVVRVSLAADL